MHVFMLQCSSRQQTSLLGDPPKEIHLSTNPYLNLASVLPSMCLSGKQHIFLWEMVAVLADKTLVLDIGYS